MHVSASAQTEAVRVAEVGTECVAVKLLDTEMQTEKGETMDQATDYNWPVTEKDTQTDDELR